MSLILFAILFAGVLQGIILVVLLFRKTDNRLSNRILGWLVSVLVVHLSLVAIDVRDLFLVFPHLSRLSWLIPHCYGPLLLLLTQSIVIRGFRLQWVHLTYFLPMLVYLTLLSPYYLSGTEEKLAYLSDPVGVNRADFGIYNHLTNYFHIGFTSAALIIFYRNRKALPDFFSDPGPARLAWLKTFLWVIWSIMVFSWICFISRRYNWPWLSSLYPNNFLLAVFVVYWLSYKLLLNPYRWDQTVVPPKDEPVPAPPTLMVQEESAPVKYQKTAIPVSEIAAIKVRLLQWMVEAKPYLNPALTIDDLSAQLNVRRHHLSQVINQEFSRNFFEFVNGYRIDAFKQMALKPENSHLSIMGLAFDCGFNSKATFNQVFKKQEGITPSAFLKQARGVKTEGI
ncbi:helix-turn-helix transcriptional regulator [Terrimonas sp. NA20]|uniref:Helix-turn-helix transcriptional regulator n=1 Tax=Terrimonas ginsenosidimutans TaxID=2908004 RepID=A0ABS9KVQ6_9BACT|nr:helix-turn-helix transcriptional regulator [Terrimonas ginsenosidimutans]MCG2616454.1 helix-turn-helix transcriptional regulator [Terrimonas ginsenosidimutans]